MAKGCVVKTTICKSKSATAVQLFAGVLNKNSMHRLSEKPKKKLFVPVILNLQIKTYVFFLHIVVRSNFQPNRTQDHPTVFDVHGSHIIFPRGTLLISISFPNSKHLS